MSGAYQRATQLRSRLAYRDPRQAPDSLSEDRRLDRLQSVGEALDEIARRLDSIAGSTPEALSSLRAAERSVREALREVQDAARGVYG